MTMHNPSRKEVLEHFGFGTKKMKNIKICPSCGNAQKAKNRFCEVCHTKLTSDTLFDIYKANHRCCEQCRNVLPNNAEFCPVCGTKQNKKREVI